MREFMQGSDGRRSLYQGGGGGGEHLKVGGGLNELFFSKNNQINFFSLKCNACLFFCSQASNLSKKFAFITFMALFRLFTRELVEL
jgi:hypothetical protein